MIVKAWGSWELFQSLLRVLRTIGDRHNGLSISNIATRWVLDHAFVGAVLIGESPLRFVSWTGILRLDSLRAGTEEETLSLPYLSLIVILSSRTRSIAYSCFLTGVRLGLSEHADDNGRAFGFRLTDTDNQDIDVILHQSNSQRMITTIGDCGAEYRQL